MRFDIRRRSTLAGDVVSPQAVGSCVLRATQAGDIDHDPAAAVERTVNVVADSFVFADGFE